MMESKPNEGLNPLDEDRARSMADEGGAAAASVEATAPVSPGSTSAIWMGALVSILAVNLILLWKARCRSSSA
jgi:hypothetical protein